MSSAALSHDPLWPRAGGCPSADEAHGDLVVVRVPTHRTSLSGARADATPDAIRDALRRFGTHARWADGTALDLDTAEIDASCDTSDGRTVRLGALAVLETAAGVAERR